MAKNPVRVVVMLKEGVLDPQGDAVLGAMKSLGFERASRVRVGKVIELDLETELDAECKQELERMATELLSNPIVEDFRIDAP